jgi:hypothetical protein
MASQDLKLVPFNRSWYPFSKTAILTTGINKYVNVQPGETYEDTAFKNPLSQQMRLILHLNYDLLRSRPFGSDVSRGKSLFLDEQTIHPSTCCSKVSGRKSPVSTLQVLVLVVARGSFTVGHFLFSTGAHFFWWRICLSYVFPRYSSCLHLSNFEPGWVGR